MILNEETAHDLIKTNLIEQNFELQSNKRKSLSE